MTEDKELKLLETIKERYEMATSNQNTIFTKFAEYYQYYRGSFPLEKTWRSQLFVPYIKQTIDTIVPRMVSQKPKLNVLPREDGDIDSAQQMEKLVDYQWYKMKMNEKLKGLVKTGLIYGVGLVKLGWDYDKNSEKDGIWCELISNYDFFIDPSSTNIEDAGWVIYKQDRDLADLKKNKNYKNIDKLEQQLSSDTNQYKQQEKASISRNSDKKDSRKKVTVYEYYGRIAFKEDEPEQDMLIVTANNGVILRATPLDEVYPCGKPFVVFMDDVMPLDFWAIGEVEPLIPLQDELNTMRNQRLDNRKLIINPMWLFNNLGGVNPDDLISRPGGMIETTDINAVKPLPVNDTTGASVEEEAIIKQDMDRTSGVYAGMTGQLQNQIGGAGASTTTARGFLASIEQAGTRMQYKLDNLEDAIVNIGQKMLKLNQKYIETDQIIRIVGKGGVKFEKVTVEDIKKDYDMFVEGGSTQPQNKQTRINDIMQILQTVMPLAQAPMFDYEPGGQPVPAQMNLKYYIDQLLNIADLPNKEEAFIEQPQQPPIMSPK